MPAFVIGDPVEHREQVEGRLRLRSALQHRDHRVAQNDDLGLAHPRAVAGQDRRRGLGQHASLGVVGEGGDAPVLQRDVHHDLVAASRVVRRARPARHGQAPGACRIRRQPQQLAFIERVAQGMPLEPPACRCR